MTVTSLLMNTFQAAQKIILKHGRSSSHGAIPSIQGEGAHQGRAAWFIRLGGCDVGCVWCDVKESWDVTAHPWFQ